MSTSAGPAPRTKYRTEELLKLAGVPSSDEKATAWLSAAIEGARPLRKIAKERLAGADHNDLMAGIEATAKKLTERIKRLRRYPPSWRAFWLSSVFGPLHLDRGIDQAENHQVMSALETIVRAAGAAREPTGSGRRREVGKHNIVNLAVGFFVRFSPRKLSGSPTGPFAEFAREFYRVATGFEPEDDGDLDRQIRHAARSARQVSRRKSA